MTAFWAIFAARFRLLLQYRAAAAAGVVTQVFWGLIRMMIFTAFYESARGPQPMTIAETVGYVWLSQSMIALMPWRIDAEIEDLIRSGNVAYELARPVDLQLLWYGRCLALRLAPLLLRMGPIVLLAWLFFGLSAPASVWAAGAFVLSVLAAGLLAAAITLVATLSLLWTVSGRGMRRIVPALATLFSGLIVPLPLFPDWSQPVIRALPFRGILDVPIRFYLGHIPVEQLPLQLLGQLTWTAGLLLVARWMLAAGLKRVVIQGG